MATFFAPQIKSILRFTGTKLSKALSTQSNRTAREKLYYNMSRDRYADLSEQKNNMYFGAEVVNRVSFLREDNDFISNAIEHSSSRFVFFDDTNPLVNKRSEKKLVMLANGDNQLEKDDINTGLLSQQKWKDIISTWAEDNKEQSPSMRDKGKPTFLFMGMKDESVGLNLAKLKARELGESDHLETYLDHQGRYQGVPYFAVDLTGCQEATELVRKFVISNTGIEESDLIFSFSRKHTMGFHDDEAALFSHGKMFLDWLYRNKFCPGCGSTVIPIHAGGKLKCTNEKLTTKEDPEKGTVTVHDCPVKNKSVSNVSFPRTDAVIITAITNTDKTKVLLSLSKRYAYSKMYSCTAGFMEPSETVEVATKREIWEETGVVCSDINIVLTQPWPFPANLMIGCIGTVDFNGVNEVIHLGHDRELADAQWFDIEYVRSLIYNPEKHEDDPNSILLPFSHSIAYLLIRMVVDQGLSSKL